ncbi:MAG: glycosyltransferase family 2 protein [Cyclobacteriaceae bacterium]|nr:glycosyltransferase family 2 protein [Cyclobacteriaceae bacterium]
MVRPVIHLYTLCHNEEFMIPYFLRHYLPFVSKIIVFDNFSTDQSAIILSKYANILVKKLDTDNEYREDILTEIRNTVWKKSRGHADLVIVCDMDEMLYHPDIPLFLSQFIEGGFSVARPFGYDMISRKLPATSGQIYQEVQEGVRMIQWDKMVLFRPDFIEEINYFPGAHMALPEGRVKIYKHDPLLKLLHFRYLGTNYLLQKHGARAKRMDQSVRTNNWGYHYLFDEKKQLDVFEAAYQRRVKVC